MLPRLVAAFFWGGMSAPETSHRESRILSGLFLAALAFHLWAVTYNWKMPYMAGHEFRQAQTAITSYYIDQQDNFGLLYETPILGKPWVSILMEVPVYEWTVVCVSRLTGLPHVEAARGVSTGCFYLMLPAIYLLLARLGFSRPRRLLALALVLASPAYIYYTRAFLMDAMTLMCCAWWLLGFVRTMDTRRWPWLVLTIVAGSLAALIKSAIFAVWLWPAAGYGAWLLWQDIRAARAGGSWKAPVKTALWGLATVAVALGLLRAWILYTDPIKAAHDSAWIFTSKNLAQGNWGLFDLRPLFSADTWSFLLRCWDESIMSRWLVGMFVAAGLVLAKSRKVMLGVGGIFFFAQAMFPYAYAYQDYYFYSCIVFLNVGIAALLGALLDSRLPRWAVVVLCAVPFVAQVDAYRRSYWVGQNIWAEGTYPITNVIRELTPKDSVIIVAGADWSAVVPLYSQRRALMVRNGLEYDSAYLKKALDRLEDEEVSAVVIMNNVRTNRNFIDLLAARYDLDASTPTLSWAVADVYIPRLYRQGVQLRIKLSARYPQVTVPRAPEEDLPQSGRFAISPLVAHKAFVTVSPAPFQGEFQFGLNWIEHGRDTVMSAHPDSNLWLRAPEHATHIEWGFGIFPGAYADPGKSTNGVEFIVDAEQPDGKERRIYRRVLDPMNQPADRGDQHVSIPYTPQPGDVLRFSTRPNENSAFDWAYWIGMKVQ